MNIVRVCEVIDEVMLKRGYTKRVIHLNSHTEVQYVGPGGGICIPQESILDVFEAIDKASDLASARLP